MIIGMQDQHKFVRLFLLGAVLVLSTKRAFCFNSIPSPDGVDNNSSNKDDNNGEGNKDFAAGAAGKIPFMGAMNLEYQDPFAKGFEITTRVYTNPDDKLAHFDDENFPKESDKTSNEKSSKPIVLPYWECGVAGSTTVPVPLSSLTVRHLLGGSKPGSFETGCGRGETVGVSGRGIGASSNENKHPRLIVPLTNMEIVLNSGQTRIFLPGDVILLENCLTGGHILQGHEGQDMVAMMLTLPHAYHHSGKENNSLSSIFEKNFWKQNPCNTGLASSGGEQPSQGPRADLVQWTKSVRVRRRLGLGVIGAGISLALADFLGKVAPLKLAVVAGGGLVATGGTIGIVKLGELALDELDFWKERRQLRLQDGSSSASKEASKKTSSDDIDAAVFAGTAGLA